jgi:hypothetical protein
MVVTRKGARGRSRCECAQAGLRKRCTDHCAKETCMWWRSGAHVLGSVACGDADGGRVDSSEAAMV